MGRLVNATLDMAERMAKRHIPMTMEDWAKPVSYTHLYTSQKYKNEKRATR